MKKYILIFLVAVFNQAMAQSTADFKIIPKAQLLQDLNILESNLQQVHAGLYTYNSRERFNAFFNEIRTNLVDMTGIEFYRQVAPVLQLIKNGHTQVFAPGEWQDYIEIADKLLPFDVYFIAEELYVIRNMSDASAIQAGDKILAINDQPMAEILKTLRSRWTSDGDNTTLPDKVIAEDFRKHFALNYGLNDDFKIEFVNATGAEQAIQIPALSNQRILEKAFTKYNYKPLTSEDWKAIDKLKFTVKDDHAVLKVPTFELSAKGENGKSFKRFYQDCFQTIQDKKVQTLVLDLRDNGGGEPKHQVELLKHLFDDPFFLYQDAYSITNKIADKAYYYREFPNKLFTSKLALKKRDSVFVARRWIKRKAEGVKSKQITPFNNVFKGKLYVLINGWSFSATGETAALLKAKRPDTIFIGEECGGNAKECTSGLKLFLTLPHSKVTFLMPFIKYVLDIDTQNTHHGVIPDFKLTETLGDILAKEDSVLDWTISHIQSQ
ncbi:MAG: S41 family peptidase [Saprospiraceae bacterium]